MLCQRKIAPERPDNAPWERWNAGYCRVGRPVRGRDAEGSTRLGIATVAIAIGYLLVFAAGFVGALSILVWGFGEPPSRGTEPESRDVEGLPSTDRSGAVSIPPAPIGPERSEDEAA